jgi:hypothetical protein
MRMLTLLALTITLALPLGAAGPGAANCNPVGNVRFVCDQVSPEDLAPVPNSDWVLSSGMAVNGAIRLINTRDKNTTLLFPAGNSKERFDSKTYNSCPGPIDPTEKEKFRAHGLYLRPGRDSVHKLYVVHHGNRESVEIFELDTRPKVPTLTWIGCAVAPDPIGLNSVVGLPDGGFLATNFAPRGNDAVGLDRMMAGENNGEVWEWHTHTGWKIVPGSQSAGANGLEISKDSKWLYIGGWGTRSVIRLSRGRTPVKREAVEVGFRVDNLRWAPDGMLLAAGQGGTAPSQTSNVAKVDPSTLQFRELVRYPYSNALSTGTVAIQMGKELWVGSVPSDRIAIFPIAEVAPDVHQGPVR